MDIRCEKCNTEYELDNSMIPPEGAPVKCTTCGHTFYVYPPGGPAQAPGQARAPGQAQAPAQAPTQAQSPGVVPARISPQVNTQPPPVHFQGYLIRGPDGREIPVADVHSLNSLIAEGRLSPDDLVRTAYSDWIRAGDMPELAQAYQQRGTWPGMKSGSTPVRSSSTAGHSPYPPSGPAQVPAQVPQRGTASQYPHQSALPPQQYAPSQPQPGTPSSPPPSHPPAAVPVQPQVQPQAQPRESNASWAGDAVAPQPVSEPDFSSVPASKEAGWQDGTVSTPPEPAWSDAPRVVSTRHVSDEELEDFAPKRRWGLWIAFIVIFVFIGAIVAFCFLNRPVAEKMMKSITGKEEKDRSEELRIKAQEYYLLDTDQSFVQAASELEKLLGVKEGNSDALALLSQIHATWAQYLRDAALDREDEAEQLEKKGETGAAATARNEAERYREEFRDRLEKAKRFAQEAIKKDPENPEAIRAVADQARLEEDFDKAKETLDRLVGARSQTAETRYLRALLALDMKHDIPAAVRNITKALENDGSLIRVRYRAARIFAVAGDTGIAKKHLEGILKLNPAHNRARDLLIRIDSKAPIVLYAESKDEEEVDAGTVATEEPDEEVKDVEQKKPARAAGGFGMGSVDRMLDRAVSLQERGKNSEAVALFKRVLEEEPRNSEALAGMGYAYMDQGRTGSAIDSFRRAVSINPRYGPALIGLGEAFSSSGSKELALQYYKKYLDVNPSGPHSYMAKRKVQELENALKSSSPPAAATEDAPPQAETETAEPEQEAPSSSTKKLNRIVPPPDEPVSDKPAVDSEPPGLPPVKE